MSGTKTSRQCSHMIRAVAWTTQAVLTPASREKGGRLTRTAVIELGNSVTRGLARSRRRCAMPLVVRPVVGSCNSPFRRCSARRRQAWLRTDVCALWSLWCVERGLDRSSLVPVSKTCPSSRVNNCSTVSLSRDRVVRQTSTKSSTCVAMWKSKRVRRVAQAWARRSRTRRTRAEPG